MRDDGGANMHVGSEAADMIKVLMGVDKKPNGLIRN
jgi:hypothetical protein